MKTARSRVLISLALLAVTTNLYGQSSGSSSIGMRFGKDISHAGKGAVRTLASPFRWQAGDWAKFGVIIGGTAALFLVDEEVHNFFLRNQSSTADKFADAGIWYGEPITVVTITGIYYVIGLVGDVAFLRESGVALTGALVATGAYQTLIKRAVGRARPELGKGATAFDPFNDTQSYFSFFSGHTLAAMSLSHVFAKRIDNVPVKIVLYSLGSLTGLARMYESDHWLSDVFVGSVVGILAVDSNLKWLERKKADGEYAGLQWRMVPSTRGLGVDLEW